MNKPSKPVLLSAHAVSDPLWARLREEAQAAVEAEPALGAFLHGFVLDQPSLEEAVVSRLAHRLHRAALPEALIAARFREALAHDPKIAAAFRADLLAVYDRDPACWRLIEPLLYFKGFHALQTHRLAHWLLAQGRRDFALYLQSLASELFQVDINPAAKIGQGVFLDHATGIVIGETAVVEDGVSILQGVTLGGTGKETGDRHPKIRQGVLIGAQACVLGNIEVGHASRIAAGSVVLKDVPPCTTVAGVPAKVIGEAGCAEPARAMEHRLDPGL